MIIDNIKNAAMYLGINENLDKALKFMMEHDFTKMEPQKLDIDGDTVYGNCGGISTLGSTEGREFEAHNNFGDIHYAIEGSELFGYAFRGDLDGKGYVAEKDCEMLTGEGSMIEIAEGSFAIVFPDDAHMPNCAPFEGARMRKVLIKFHI